MLTPKMELLIKKNTYTGTSKKVCHNTEIIVWVSLAQEYGVVSSA